MTDQEDNTSWIKEENRTISEIQEWLMNIRELDTLPTVEDCLEDIEKTLDLLWGENQCDLFTDKEKKHIAKAAKSINSIYRQLRGHILNKHKTKV